MSFVHFTPGALMGGPGAGAESNQAPISGLGDPGSLQVPEPPALGKPCLGGQVRVGGCLWSPLGHRSAGVRPADGVSVTSDFLRVEGPVMRQRALLACRGAPGVHFSGFPPRSPFLPFYLSHFFPTISPV